MDSLDIEALLKLSQLTPLPHPQPSVEDFPADRDRESHPVCGDCR
ncbi:hypothetical protein APTSU1_000741200 [Apodemus speciosus]|uniref:Uncharacterized protein n=1 Tax=Apodemus speciosus TaxID=105296 RepID=A0ABQ0EZF7_APOSI